MDQQAGQRQELKPWSPARPLTGVLHAQELVFMGERCRDDQPLSEYGVCEDFITQACSAPGSAAAALPL